MKLDFFIANESHIKEIVDLCNEIFEEETNYEEALRIFKETENDKNQIYIVGVINGKVIAHAKITIIPTIYKDMNKYAILNHVCVNKEYRKHKIGTKMLLVAEILCKKHNCTSIKLWSGNQRVAAHACYKKFGFISDDSTFFSKKI